MLTRINLIGGAPSIVLTQYTRLTDLRRVLLRDMLNECQGEVLLVDMQIRVSYSGWWERVSGIVHGAQGVHQPGFQRNIWHASLRGCCVKGVNGKTTALYVLHLIVSKQTL